MKHILCLLSLFVLLVGCAETPYTYSEKSIDLQLTTVIIPKGYEVIAFGDYDSIILKDPKKPNEYIKWNYSNDERTVYVQGK